MMIIFKKYLLKQNNFNLKNDLDNDIDEDIEFFSLPIIHSRKKKMAVELANDQIESDPLHILRLKLIIKCLTILMDT